MYGASVSASASASGSIERIHRSSSSPWSVDAEMDEEQRIF